MRTRLAQAYTLVELMWASSIAAFIIMLLISTPMWLRHVVLMHDQRMQLANEALYAASWLRQHINPQMCGGEPMVATIFNRRARPKGIYIKAYANTAALLLKPLKAHGTASKQQLLHLSHIITSAPKPILIHCVQGSDRTGMASALAIILLSKYHPLSWRRQMSYAYGVASPNTIGYHVFNPYIKWLQHQQLSDNKQNFNNWLNHQYTPTTKPYGWFWML